MDCFAPLALVIVCALSAQAADLPKPSTPLLSAMRLELQHSLGALKGEPLPPYFLSYAVTENHTYRVSASLGALTGSDETRSRVLDLDVRVGAPERDNTHALRGVAGIDFKASQPSHFLLPLDDDGPAIRSEIWFKTDEVYKKSVEQLGKVRTNMQVSVAEEDPSGDFAAAPQAESIQAPTDLKLDRAVWEARLKRLTLPFRGQADLEGGSATFQAQATTFCYVNSEGTLLQVPQISVHLVLSAHLRAKDGMNLHRVATYFATRPEDLPAEKTMLARAKELITELRALRDAPLAEPYTGPAILSGRAASVFFHEVFGHRAEGHRLKGEWEGQTFKKMIGQRLLPESMSVYCDPTLERYGGTTLAGHYLFDDEGVRARRVPLIDQGILKSFLTSRIPIAGFPASNGHGRHAPGLAPVTRQSNLVVEAAAPVSRARLKELLLAQIKEQNKPFGLLIDDLDGGFTLTTRVLPNSFNLRATLVYQVYPDGREQLVRGVDLIGTPLDAFTRVLAADDQPQVFNGFCGAESGFIPVSAVAPGLLLSQIEIQKKEQNQGLPPILPPPSDPSERR